MTRSLSLASAMAVAVALLMTSSPGAQSSSRMVDRTFACTLDSPTLDVTARAGVRYEGTARWKWLAHTSAYTKEAVLVAMSAGAPKPPPTELYAQETTLSVNALACRPRRASVPLVPRGLPQGGRADVFGDTFDCFTPRTVLLRIRAEFRSPTSLQRRSGTFQGRRWSILQTTVPARNGRFVLATLAGKRIAYGDVHESGRARVFVRGDCFPD